MGEIMIDVKSKPDFNGDVYESNYDRIRLTGQIHRIFNVMKDEKWRTLDEISEVTNDPQASISAQLRHLRKSRFGEHKVYKKHRGERKNGLWEYQLIVNE
jgi:DNA-binding transcriptional regulator GbsR (MarR family)